MRVAERVLLSSIKTLTLFADEDTFFRRTDPIPQLTCIGQVCKLYQPQAVLCTNIGGGGTEVNWKVSPNFGCAHFCSWNPWFIVLSVFDSVRGRLAGNSAIRENHGVVRGLVRVW
jgi:SOCE-associated regulatory factor of calcium homoeostasis